MLEGSSLLTRVGRNLCETNWNRVFFPSNTHFCSLPQLCVCSHSSLPHTPFPPLIHKSHLCIPYFCFSLTTLEPCSVLLLTACLPSLTPSCIKALFLLRQSLINKMLASKEVYGEISLSQALLQETSGRGLQTGVTTRCSGR